MIASSDEYAQNLLERADQALADDAVYQRVLGGSADRSLAQVFVRVDRIRSFVETTLRDDERAMYERDVKPWLSLFEAFGARATITGNESEFRAVLSLAS